MEEKTPQVSAEEKKGGIWDTIRFIVISLVIVFGIRMFIAQPFIVSGESMVPTFENGEYLIVDQLSYRFEKPARGDVIIMRYPLDTRKFFIKRIIGLPGETVSITGDKITITPAGGGSNITLDEAYIKNIGNDSMTITLDDSHYFVMGDNRPASSDSRRWGPLPSSDIVGRPLLRLYPLNHISYLPGIETYSATSTK